MDTAEIKDLVRARYGSIAAAASSACCAPATACCGPAAEDDLTGFDAKASRMGYSEAELEAVPEGANLGLGCGNPQAIAALRPGEVLVDLGSGAGFDCLLAARQVGATGRVIGVDMTHEMLKKAHDNAARVGAARVGAARVGAARVGAAGVEFRLGEIEQ